MESFIIDPSELYWMSVLDGLHNIFIVLALISIGSAMFFGLFGCVGEDEDEIKIGCICLIPAIIFAIAAIFCPSKETSVEMMVARLVTVENIDTAADRVKEIVNYIARVIK